MFRDPSLVLVVHTISWQCRNMWPPLRRVTQQLTSPWASSSLMCSYTQSPAVSSLLYCRKMLLQRSTSYGGTTNLHTLAREVQQQENGGGGVVSTSSSGSDGSDCSATLCPCQEALRLIVSPPKPKDIHLQAQKEAH